MIDLLEYQHLAVNN